MTLHHFKQNIIYLHLHIVNIMFLKIKKYKNTKI